MKTHNKIIFVSLGFLLSCPTLQAGKALSKIKAVGQQALAAITPNFTNMQWEAGQEENYIPAAVIADQSEQEESDNDYISLKGSTLGDSEEASNSDVASLVSQDESVTTEPVEAMPEAAQPLALPEEFAQRLREREERLAANQPRMTPIDQQPQEETSPRELMHQQLMQEVAARAVRIAAAQEAQPAAEHAPVVAAEVAPEVVETDLPVFGPQTREEAEQVFYGPMTQAEHEAYVAAHPSMARRAVNGLKAVKNKTVSGAQATLEAAKHPVATAQAAGQKIKAAGQTVAQKSKDGYAKGKELAQAHPTATKVVAGTAVAALVAAGYKAFTTKPEAHVAQKNIAFNVALTHGSLLIHTDGSMMFTDEDVAEAVTRALQTPRQGANGEAKAPKTAVTLETTANNHNLGLQLYLTQQDETHLQIALCKVVRKANGQEGVLVLRDSRTQEQNKLETVITGNTLSDENRAILGRIAAIAAQ